MREQGLVIVISAPSGAGKSTLSDRLVRKRKSVRCSISCTTRPPRRGERHGVDYYFVPEAEFKRLIRRRMFIEWARVHGHYYGTPRRELERMVRSGIDVILDIDVQGGLNIRRLYPGSVLIFVMTPSMKDLEKRLRDRNNNSEADIRRRLANARREIKYIPRYDYLVINDRLEDAVARLDAIITAEHLKTANTKRHRI